MNNGYRQPSVKQIQNNNFIYAADGGGTDAYAISLVPAISSYTIGMRILFKANTENVGAASLNVNGKGAITIKKNGNIDLSDGDILVGKIVDVIYDGTNFQMISHPNPSAWDFAVLTANAIDGIEGLLNCNSGSYSGIPLSGVATEYVDGLGTFSTPGSVANSERVKVYLSANQSIPDNALTSISWGGEYFDLASMWSGANPSRLVANSSGLFHVYGVVYFTNNTSVYGQVNVYKNGNTQIYDAGLAGIPTNNGWYSASVSFEVELNAGDYIEFRVLQHSGGAIPVYGNGADGTSMFGMTNLTASTMKTVNDAVSIKSTSSQTLTSGSETAVGFNTSSEEYDTNAMHSANDSKLTAKSDGMYLVWGVINYAANDTGVRQLSFRKNNSVDYYCQYLDADTRTTEIVNGCVVVALATNEYMELVALQDSGGDLNIMANNTRFGMIKISA